MVVRDVRKTYDGRAVVDGVNLEVRPGTCLGIVGPNGAGKSTTLKMIYGLAEPEEGELRVFDVDVRRERREVKARVGVVPQELNLDHELTVRQNLVQQGRYFRMPRRVAEARAEELLALAGLSLRASDRVAALSGGMKRRLMIARGLVNHPELLVLDEPSVGLDPRARRSVWSLLRDVRRDGVTVLLSTHYMDEAAELCDWVAIMDAGRVVVEGEPAILIEQHAGSGIVEVEVGDTPHMEWPLRRAPTLEDVFLRVTGRAFGEGEAS